MYKKCRFIANTGLLYVLLLLPWTNCWAWKRGRKILSPVVRPAATHMNLSLSCYGIPRGRAIPPPPPIVGSPKWGGGGGGGECTCSPYLTNHLPKLAAHTTLCFQHKTRLYKMGKVSSAPSHKIQLEELECGICNLLGTFLRRTIGSRKIALN